MKKPMILGILCWMILGLAPTRSLDSCATSMAKKYTSGMSPSKVANLISSSSPFPNDSIHRLTLSIIAVESGFRTDVVSPAGAIGLMQLTRLAVEDASLHCVMPVPPRSKWKEPNLNIRLGLCYLDLMAKKSRSTEELLVLYNGGYKQLALMRQGIPITTETRQYVKSVFTMNARHCQ